MKTLCLLIHKQNFDWIRFTVEIIDYNLDKNSKEWKFQRQTQSKYNVIFQFREIHTFETINYSAQTRSPKKLLFPK